MITIEPHYSHENFVEALERGNISVEIDSEKASELATEGILGRTLQLNAYAWGCGWLSCFFLAPLLVYFYSWWWLLLLPVGLILPQGLRWINYRNVLWMLKENEEFYELSREHDVVTTIKKTGDST